MKVEYRLAVKQVSDDFGKDAEEICTKLFTNKHYGSFPNVVQKENAFDISYPNDLNPPNMRYGYIFVRGANYLSIEQILMEIDNIKEITAVKL